MTQPRKIGFRTSADEELDVEPMKQINTTKESEEEQNSNGNVRRLYSWCCL